MKKSELKIMAMESCYLSDLPNKTKIKHLKVIKENLDTYQCIGYILDGKFYNLNESGKEEIKRRFIKEQQTGEIKRKEIMSQLGKSAGGIYGVAGIVKHVAKGGAISPLGFFLHLALTYFGGWVLWSSYRWVRSWFDKASRECKKYGINDLERQMCMKKVKEQYNKKLEALTKQGYKIKQSGKKLSKEERAEIKKKMQK